MRLKRYLRDIYDEMIHKVTWPTWKELQSSAIIVMVASLLIAVVILGMDSTFGFLMKTVYGWLYYWVMCL